MYADLAAFIDAASTANDAGFAKNELFPETQVQMSLGEVAAPRNASNSVISQKDIAELISTFEHAKTFGSLIQISPKRLPELRRQLSILSEVAQKADWVGKAAANDLLPLVQQALVLGMQFDAVVANPPYMGSKFYSSKLKEFILGFYPSAKADLYSAFIQKNIDNTNHGGIIGMITIPNWMFLSSFEALRKYLISKTSIDSFIHNGRGVWGSDFGSCSFILRKKTIDNFIGVYKKLFDKQGSVSTNEEMESKFFDEKNNYYLPIKSLREIPGSPIAFWIPQNARNAFSNNSDLATFVQPQVGLQTGDNERFLRLWHEISRACYELCRGWSEL